MTRLIYSMATDIKKVIKWTENRSHAFYTHACNIMANPHLTIDWWSKELYGFCEWLQDIIFTHNKKSVNKDFVKKYLFKDFGMDSFESFVKKLDREFENQDENKGKTRNKSNDKILFSNYPLFCDEVSVNIENNTLTINKMRELVQKYLIIQENKNDRKN